MDLVIVDTGVANVASVRFAFARLGVRVRVSSDAKTISEAERLVLPGVGSAQAGMAALRAKELEHVFLDYQRPLLGICLGMQLLFLHSAEGDTACLGLIPDEVVPLPVSDGPVPHMGWNQLRIVQDDPFLAGVRPDSYVYFVHSFAARTGPNTLASTSYGLDFSAIIRRDNLYACQFHPERSGEAGARILQNFLEAKP